MLGERGLNRFLQQRGSAKRLVFQRGGRAYDLEMLSWILGQFFVYGIDHSIDLWVQPLLLFKIQCQ